MGESADTPDHMHTQAVEDNPEADRAEPVVRLQGKVVRIVGKHSVAEGIAVGQIVVVGRTWMEQRGH